MTAKRITMEQIRLILQKSAKGLSIRSISKFTGCSRNTIKGYLRTVAKSEHDLVSVQNLSDEELSQLLFHPDQRVVTDKRYLDFQQRLPEFSAELKKRHVTRQILWEEYRQAYPDGYGYTRFCHHLNTHIGINDVTAIFTHRPAEKLMFDYAGDKLSYINRESGEAIPCEVFVAVLPFSSYIYAVAMESQKQEDLVKGVAKSFTYIGGVTQSALFDNLKSAVKKPNRYEPTFTELIEQLGFYYDTTFMATRVRKPRDKATVESSVNVVYQRIYAKLRNMVFYSVKEINEAILVELEVLNNRNFKGRDYSRRDMFEQYERPLLQPLPTAPFEIKKVVMAKVQKNYHVQLGEDMHLYSVHWSYARKIVKVTYTSDTVEIYLDHKRIAVHRRNYRKHNYTTLNEHMPPNHRAIKEQQGWDTDYFLKEAKKVGENTYRAIEQVLESKSFPEQTYNSCLGILRLGKKYDNDRLEDACQLMLRGPKANYGILKNILANNKDKQLNHLNDESFQTPDHENIRGPFNFF